MTKCELVRLIEAYKANIHPSIMIVSTKEEYKEYDIIKNADYESIINDIYDSMILLNSTLIFEEVRDKVLDILDKNGYIKRYVFSYNRT